MKKINPFRKYLTQEQKLQESCVKFLKLQYPNLLFTHVPNEGKKSAFERFLYKIMGVRTGISDILIFKPSNGYNGLAIELKVGKNKTTDLQNKFLKDIYDCGWSCFIVYSLEGFIDVVNNYFKKD